jgi:hypothetical protein
VDVFISHDWPLSIEQHGDTQGLIREKPFFRQEVRSNPTFFLSRTYTISSTQVNTNTLGSPPLWSVLRTIQPSYWFAAHLHVKFPAIVEHSSLPEEKLDLKEMVKTNPQTADHEDLDQKLEEEAVEDETGTQANEEPSVEIKRGKEECACEEEQKKDTKPLDVNKLAAKKLGKQLGKTDQGDQGSERPQKRRKTATSGGKVTKFLALNKVGPRKEFLQVSTC